MQYKIKNGSVSYDGEMILENIDIEINDGEKIAIVGRNGCGKTTLLKAIVNQVELEEGTGEEQFRVQKTGTFDIGYLRQMPFENESTSLVDEVRSVFSDLIEMEKQLQVLVEKMDKSADEHTITSFTRLNDIYIAKGGLTYQKEYKTMIRRFGFTEEDEKRSVSEFSGGQRTKISFIKMLLSKPDILLLDEPTNHLDIETIEWLEDYLRDYKSTLVIVSHDRMFLDRIVNKVYEIEWGETRCYKGNYSSFERQKQENYVKQLQDYERQQKEIARITRLIERFRYKATKAKMVQSKIKLLEHMEKIYAPSKADESTFRLKLQPSTQSSRQVLDVRNLVIGYNSPLAKVSFNLEKGQRLGIIGGNGTGKSTLLKTLTGAIPSLSGEFSFGYNTKVAYFDQQLAHISGEDSVFDAFSREYPQLTDTEVRSALGVFQFSGDDVFRPISTLSGGERVRLTLCKIMFSRPNVLILDEPTNHLDIIGKQSLEDILSKYEGTIIFVSHDRYFVKKIADNLLVFENGYVKYCDCSFDEYESKRAKVSSPQLASAKVTTPDKQKARSFSPKKEIDKKKRRIERLEMLIGECEEKIALLNEQIESDEVCSDYQKLTQLQEELDEIKRIQLSYEDEWTQLMQELEDIEE